METTTIASMLIIDFIEWRSLKEAVIFNYFNKSNYLNIKIN